MVNDRDIRGGVVHVSIAGKRRLSVIRPIISKNDIQPPKSEVRRLTIALLGCRGTGTGERPCRQCYVNSANPHCKNEHRRLLNLRN